MSDFGQKMSKSGQKPVLHAILSEKEIGLPNFRLKWHVACIPYCVGYPVLWSKK
jgi:hypothetical protein